MKLTPITVECPFCREAFDVDLRISGHRQTATWQGEAVGRPTVTLHLEPDFHHVCDGHDAAPERTSA